MSSREFSGRSAAEAAIKACEELGVPRSALKYQVVSESGSGLDKKVVITVDADQAKAAASESPFEERASGAGDRGSFRDRPPRDEGAPRDHEPRRDFGGDRGPRGDRGGERGGRGRRGGGGGGRGRDRDGGRGGERGGRGGRGDFGDRPRRDREGESIEGLLNLDTLPTSPVEVRPDVEGGERAKKALGVIAEMLKLAGFGVEPHLVQDGPEEIVFDLRGADEAKVIGKKGETLLSMQFLVNRMITRAQEEGEQHIVLDAANYRTRRRDALASLATKLASRALEENKVVRLSPMSAHDRRIFHITLHEKPGITTRSEGEGLYRPLLIIPTGE